MYSKLLNNRYGWDVSMLTYEAPTQDGTSVADDALVTELRSQIEKLESKIDKLNQEIGEKNALIKMMSQSSAESV
jgi:TolA-binding protein